MKKCFVLLLIMAFLFTLTACGNDPLPTSPETEALPTDPSGTEEPVPPTEPRTLPETEPETAPETEAETEPETESETQIESHPKDDPYGPYADMTLEGCLALGYREYGSYTDSVGNEYVYSYALPQILLTDLPGAQEINEAIFQDFRSIAEEELANMEEGLSLTCPTIDYVAAKKDNILSIMVNAETCYEVTYYETYNLNLETGEVATLEEVVSLFGLTEKDYKERAEAFAVEVYLARYGEDPSISEMYEDQLENTRTKNDWEQCFITPEGLLAVIADIYSLAGAKCYPTYIELS